MPSPAPMIYLLRTIVQDLDKAVQPLGVTKVEVRVRCNAEGLGEAIVIGFWRGMKTALGSIPLNTNPKEDKTSGEIRHVWTKALTACVADWVKNNVNNS